MPQFSDKLNYQRANTIKIKFNKSSLLKILRDLALLAIIFFALQAWMQRNMAEGEAPLIDAALLTGEPVNLSQFQGKPLLIHFWASWCPICKFEQGSVSDLYRDDNIQLLTIAFQSGNNREVESFMIDNGIEDWPVVVDNQGSIAGKYGVTGVPSTFFIDSNGKIRFKTRGITSKWGIKFRLWLAGFFS